MLESEHQAEIDRAQEVLDEVTEALVSRNDEVGELETQLESAEKSLETMTELHDDAQSDLDSLREENEDLEDEIQALKVQFDPEIRAAAQAAWDDEVAEACERYGATSIGRGGDFIDWVEQSDTLEIIGGLGDMEAEVEACGDPLRARSEEEKLNAECSTADEDAIERDTGSFEGECFVVFAIPFQWDSRTGPCNFLARYSGTNQGTRSFRYDATALVRGGALDVCPELEGMDQDDLIKLWVDLRGTYSYDTAAGGTNAVPEFKIRKAELITKG